MLVRLTGLPDPDTHKARPVYIESRNVLVIERGSVSFPKRGAQEAYRQAMWALYDEVTRVNEEAAALTAHMAPDNEEKAKESNRWFVAREAAQSLTTAYKLVSGELKNSAAIHPAVECTIVSLACGTALESGVMLSRVYVTESPDEVVARLHGGTAALPGSLPFKPGGPWT